MPSMRDEWAYPLRLLWVQSPGTFLPALQGLLRLKGYHPFPFCGLFQNRPGLRCAVAEQEHSCCDSDVHARVLQENGKRITSCISMGTEFVEDREVFVNMAVRSLSGSPGARLGLRLYMLGELLNELFEPHHQTPFLTFSMVCNPTARWTVKAWMLRTIAHQVSLSRRLSAHSHVPLLPAFEAQSQAPLPTI